MDVIIDDMAMSIADCVRYLREYDDTMTTFRQAADTIERLAAERDTAREERRHAVQLHRRLIDERAAALARAERETARSLALSLDVVKLGQMAGKASQARADAIEDVCAVLEDWFDIENWSSGTRKFGDLLKEVRALKEKTP